MENGVDTKVVWVAVLPPCALQVRLAERDGHMGCGL